MKCQNNLCENPVATGSGRTGKYCSRSCAAIVNNRKYQKRQKALLFICIRCGVEFKGAGTAPRKYCSQDCSSKYRAEQYIERWKVGLENGSQKGGELDLRVRKHLLAEAGFKCTKCGWGEPNPSIGKVILTVDHIDGNWKNNSVDNLVVLCYNCHTLTPTFGTLNKGNAPAGRSIGSRRH